MDFILESLGFFFVMTLIIVMVIRKAGRKDGTRYLAPYPVTVVLKAKFDK